ncbi:glycosyltransferase family 2 protein [Rhodococcus koreensis]|uniref:glycosyltransferase family 2 protein n=1 Tax=Rhodococcus koreensis TaxID=99653 RepID=UPI0019811F4F|nr:glycosyltransferase family 2 protein [Rhodococcus koreensis]QSE87080.1 glycosyltransferase family 2 protein [Rhodococcus koreensis]
MNSNCVTLLCCSYNRRDALEFTLQNKLQVRGVDELLFVLDGSTDGSYELLSEAATRDHRIRIIQKRHSGIQDTRNTGFAAAAYPWVLMIDDDDMVPTDFAEKLFDSVSGTDVGIVGAPWLNATTADIELVAAEKATARSESFGLRDSQSVFTRDDIEVPFICSAALVRRDAALQVGFDGSYKGNSWREETDFYLRMVENGHRVVRTSRTFSWLERRFSGGHPRMRLQYEAWVLVNELRFQRRHAIALRKIDPRTAIVPLEVWKTVRPRLGDVAHGLQHRLRSRLGLAT